MEMPGKDHHVNNQVGFYSTIIGFGLHLHLLDKKSYHQVCSNMLVRPHEEDRGVLSLIGVTPA